MAFPEGCPGCPVPCLHPEKYNPYNEDCENWANPAFFKNPNRLTKSVGANPLEDQKGQAQTDPEPKP